MSDGELSPDEEREIGRLLAEAASPAPLPAEVAIRLDDVLAGLVAEREEETNVVPLRSRRWPKVLVAAAAVSLFGYAGSQLVQQSADDAGTMAEGEAAAGRDDDADSPELAPQPSDGGLGAPNKPTATASVPTSNDPAEVSGTIDRLTSEFANKMAYNAGLRDAVLNELNWAAKSCSLPPTLARRTAAADLYDLRLTKRSRGFMLVQAVNGNAARVDIYSCKRPLLPISSTFLLAAR